MTPAEMAQLHAASFTLPPPWSQTELEATLANPFTFALTKPQAFLLAQVVAGEATLLTIAVAPTARRLGLGHALVADFLAQSRQRQATTAFLEVAETNQAARALYAAAGFVPTGRRKGYYRATGQSVDAILMGRAL